MFVLITSLLGVGIVITILEQFQKGESKEVREVFEVYEIEKQPGEMVWLVYEDKDKDQVFDHAEKVVKDVSVAIRRIGDREAWRTQPADVNGVVRMTDLPVGDYEVRLLNYEEVETDLVSFFPGDYLYKDQFLPSEWEVVILGEEGYEQKVGLVKHVPEKILVLKDSLGLRMVDVARQRDYGFLRLRDGIEDRQFVVSGKMIFYVEDDKLKQFDLSQKLLKETMGYLYQVDETSFSLSPGKTTLVYKDGGEFRYKSKTCGEGYVIVDGRRLLMDGMMVDYADETRMVIKGKLKGDEGWRVYEASCNEGRGKLRAEEVLDRQVSSLGFLDEQTLFYSDNSGSYFYDLLSQVSTRYVALGAGVRARISEDNKHVYGLVGGKLVVVDYPAVVASGVEKHYVIALPEGSEPSFTSLQTAGDSEPGQGELVYLDNNQVVRIRLKGSGVWEEIERVVLKGFQAQGILGEIKL